jgi:hypothetical protein
MARIRVQTVRWAISLALVPLLVLAGPALLHCERQAAAPTATQVAVTPTSEPQPGIWMSRHEILSRPTSGPAWTSLLNAARRPCGRPSLSNQNDTANVCLLAKALVFARTADPSFRVDVASGLAEVARPIAYHGTALSLGRKLGTYAIAADLIELGAFDAALDAAFRTRLRALQSAPTTAGGPRDLVDCHERRPNNWGTHCGASRAAVAAYLGDTATLARVALVFKGWLGDRDAYAGFEYGDLSWQCDPQRPVGINPTGCTKHGHPIDGVLPDDQRRGGSFSWPPPQENYAYEALQGALAQAVILQRAGYDAFTWEDHALLRAFQWLHTHARFPAAGDDAWQMHVVNYYYADIGFQTTTPARPGKMLGFTEWTHQR